MAQCKNNVIIQWSEEELMALATRITPPGKKPSVIILKYCRAVTVNGKKVYTSKTVVSKTDADQ